MTNAIKFSHRDTIIKIEVSADSENVLTKVIDHGQGIPEEEVGSVFKEFQKSSVQATEGEKSTGLGLAICKKIVEAHSGTISVESVFGQGSTFFFTLPVKSA